MVALTGGRSADCARLEFPADLAGGRPRTRSAYVTRRERLHSSAAAPGSTSTRRPVRGTRFEGADPSRKTLHSVPRSPLRRRAHSTSVHPDGQPASRPDRGSGQGDQAGRRLACRAAHTGSVLHRTRRHRGCRQCGRHGPSRMFPALVSQHRRRWSRGPGRSRRCSQNRYVSPGCDRTFFPVRTARAPDRTSRQPTPRTARFTPRRPDPGTGLTFPDTEMLIAHTDVEPFEMVKTSLSAAQTGVLNDARYRKSRSLCTSSLVSSSRSTSRSAARPASLSAVSLTPARLPAWCSTRSRSR
ncbi:hypothetical protein SAMN05421504_112196 [Amycolatopsis xylanica]|uniref:Uncharacterized protein n=1 Tax=Amycolatopsis xylanica TaxID=589385 RepID=A0A1H3S474_9PSEU|nr:hypothetical protein SAMN05421504_112196 [Amycolatopsis xylanica]